MKVVRYRGVSRCGNDLPIGRTDIRPRDRCHG